MWNCSGWWAISCHCAIWACNFLWCSLFSAALNRSLGCWVLSPSNSSRSFWRICSMASFLSEVVRSMALLSQYRWVWKKESRQAGLWGLISLIVLQLNSSQGVKLGPYSPLTNRISQSVGSAPSKFQSGSGPLNAGVSLIAVSYWLVKYISCSGSRTLRFAIQITWLTGKRFRKL